MRHIPLLAEEGNVLPPKLCPKNYKLQPGYTKKDSKAMNKFFFVPFVVGFPLSFCQRQRGAELEQLRQLFGKDVFLVIRLREEIFARFLDHALERIRVQADQLPVEFPDASADDHGIDIAPVGGLNDSADRIIGG